MVRGAIKKSDLPKLIAAASEGSTVMGPVKGPDGVSLEELVPGKDVALDYGNLKLPVKRYFFPQSEVLYTYEDDAAGSVHLPDGKVILFGVRPCDAQALLFLDKVFLDEDYIDAHYKVRRDNTLVVSLACNNPTEPCFCTSVGCGPAAREGSDVLAFDAGGSLLFESVTENGEGFIKAHADLLPEPEAGLVEAAEKLAAEAEAKLPKIDIEGLADKLKGSFESPLWQAIADRCLGCGACTYMCPTCHCFGIHDEERSGRGRRIRVQDGCLFSGFTLEASGHNPRPASGNRMRQRIMHKFCFTVQNFADVFCVGCGRCISSCPVNIDVRETIVEANR